MNENITDLAALVTSAHGVKTIENGKPFLVIPDGYKINHVEPLLQYPIRKRGVARFTALESFARYVNEHSDDTSRIFEDGCNFTAVIDFHGVSPGWAEHIAVFTPALSSEWQRWQAINGKPLAQAALAGFIERNLGDIAAPPGAALLELVENLTARCDARFEQKMGVKDGNTRVVFEEDIVVSGGKSISTGTMDLPRDLAIAVPIFTGGEDVGTVWRLRPSVRERQLLFTLELPRADEVVRDRREAMRLEIKSRTEIEPFVGSFTPVQP